MHKKRSTQQVQPSNLKGSLDCPLGQPSKHWAHQVGSLVARITLLCNFKLFFKPKQSCDLPKSLFLHFLLFISSLQWRLGTSNHQISLTSSHSHPSPKLTRTIVNASGSDSKLSSHNNLRKSPHFTGCSTKRHSICLLVEGF